MACVVAGAVRACVCVCVCVCVWKTPLHGTMSACGSTYLGVATAAAAAAAAAEKKEAEADAVVAATATAAAAAAGAVAATTAAAAAAAAAKAAARNTAPVGQPASACGAGKHPMDATSWTEAAFLSADAARAAKAAARAVNAALVDCATNFVAPAAAEAAALVKIAQHQAAVERCKREIERHLLMVNKLEAEVKTLQKQYGV